MILHNAPQGSEEWHRARAGRVTASMFKVARSKTGGLTDQQQKYVDAILSGIEKSEALTLAGYKKEPSAENIKKALNGKPFGEPTEAALKYAFRVAVEAISGLPMDEGFETWQMRRGHELEPEARERYEIKTGNGVELAGFITTDCGTYGASADGFIGDDGGLEIKCLVNPEAIRDAILYNDISEWYDQVQGGMWITGRAWWDFVIYCPALAGVNRDLSLWHVERDQDYIDDLVKDLNGFTASVNEYINQLSVMV